MGTKIAPCPDISPDKWVQHFKTLLNQEVDIEEEFANGATQYNTEHDAQCEDCDTNNVLWLNDCITVEEISKVVESMPCGKAAGNDGISIEMIKASIKGSNITTLTNIVQQNIRQW